MGFGFDLTDAFAQYELHELRHSPATVEAYTNRLKALEGFFSKKWWEISDQELREFKRTDRYKSQTIASMLTAIHMAHRWGALEGLWKLNGICEVRLPKIENEPHAPLSVETARKLLEACDRPLEYRIVWLGLYCGTRVSESARIGEREWEGDVLRFKGSKNGKVREVPVHPELERVKAAILCSPVCEPPNLHRAKRRMAERVGVEFSPHNLRSTFATMLTNAGVAWELTAALLGHELGVTARYAVIPRRRKREAIDALSYGEGT